MITILKPSALKANPGKILDKALQRPQYVDRNGVLLVITKAGPTPGTGDDSLLSSWVERAKVLEKFYDPSKAW